MVSQIRGGKIGCGGTGHYRDSCGQCPFNSSTYHGKSWCHGECKWEEIDKTANKRKHANQDKWNVHLHQLGLGAENR